VLIIVYLELLLDGNKHTYVIEFARRAYLMSRLILKYKISKSAHAWNEVNQLFFFLQNLNLFFSLHCGLTLSSILTILLLLL